jgi:crotonobetainyl-CoA:carnitine CoA-transferase CaiB-like acyl-CoA transferase
MQLLSGITVLDLSRLLPGPLSTWHLQCLGVKVIKIEHPVSGDYARAIGPVDGGDSLLYRHLNGEKLTRRLNLKDDDDRRQFLELVRGSDAVVESFRPGVMERLGVGFNDLRAMNPRISLVSISGYGRTGAMADAAGHDINYMALSGWLYELLHPTRPHMPNVQAGDVFAGALNAALALVSAILAARTSGRGHHLDVSITAGLLASLLMPMVALQN